MDKLVYVVHKVSIATRLATRNNKNLRNKIRQIEIHYKISIENQGSPYHIVAVIDMILIASLIHSSDI